MSVISFGSFFVVNRTGLYFSEEAGEVSDKVELLTKLRKARYLTKSTSSSLFCSCLSWSAKAYTEELSALKTHDDTNIITNIITLETRLDKVSDQGYIFSSKVG